MSFGLQNWLMLLGLAGVAIPIIIHLLNRRRFDIIDWGAMRFLQVSEITRRKIFIEELLLMLLRMGLIALLVVAMAAPWAAGTVFEKLGLADNRDVVLIFDGSAPMSYTDDTDKSLQQKAVEWSKELLDRLAPGDNIAVLQAREQAVPIVGELISDQRQIRKALEQLPAPSGTCDWPQALETAQQVLKNSRRSRREIILLGDGRKPGWADERTLGRFKLLAPQLTGGDTPPRLWGVTIERPAEPPPNWTLLALRSGRAQSSTALGFNSSLKVLNQNYERPYSLRYRVDRPDEPGPDAEEKERGFALTLPVRDDLRDGRLPLTFSHTFDGPGSHLVSLIVEPDSPERKKDKSLIGIAIKDRIPGDNRQDFAVMLPLVPVLLVDGLPPLPGKLQGASFLQAALAPTKGKNLLVRAKVVPIEELLPSLEKDVGPEANTKPRVLILCDVPLLSAEQREVIGKFVEAGGGLLVTHGPRTELVHANKELYRGGQGWLPTGLEEAVGQEDEPIPTDGTTPDPAAHPKPATFSHPALELFRGNQSGGLGNARFPRWWKLARPAPVAADGSGSVVGGELTTKAPMMVEKKHGKGRVVQFCVAMDETWGTNLVGVLEFPALAYELVAYLAGSRGQDCNLTPGQPLVYQPLDDESLERATLKPPRGEPIELTSKEGVFVHKDTRLPGIYTLTTSRNRTVYFVVQPDPRGADDLTLCEEKDRKQVADLIGVKYLSDRSEMLAGTEQDLWWWVLLGVIALLCSEVWMTRRIARSR